MKGEIKIEVDGLTPGELRKLHETVHTLLERDVFFMRNGKAILHFDHEGTLQEIGFDYKRWKRRKS